MLSRSSLTLCTLLCALLVAASPAHAVKPDSRAERQLKRDLKRNPKLALKPSFIRKAAASGLDLPITVRLSRRTDNAGGEEAPNDTMHLAFDQFANPVLGGQPPVDPPGGYNALTTLTLAGSYSMIARFGADTSGYGRPWVVELVQGQTINLASASITTLLNGTTPPGCGGTILSTSTPWAFSSGGPTYGTLDLLGGTYSGTLKLAASVGATQCGGAAWHTPQSPLPAAPPLPLALSGQFRLSPAITADGRVRLGKITVTDGGPSDDGNHAEVRMHCGTCTPTDIAFAGRLKALSFTAELLLGS